MSPRTKLIAAIFTGALAIGFAPIFTKLAIDRGGVGAVASGFWRMSFGVIGFLGLAWHKFERGALREKSRSLARERYGITLVAGLFFAGDLAAWHTSFAYTSVAASSLLANLSAIFVPVAGIVFFHEKMNRNLLVGGAIALVGVATLVTAGHEPTPFLSQENKALGDGLAILTAGFYSTYIIATKALSMSHATEVFMTHVCAISALTLSVIALTTGSNLVPRNAEGWLWLCMLGVVSQVLGQGLVASTLAQLPVSTSALLLLMAPTSTAIFGVVCLDQTLSTPQFTGICVTLLGLALVAMKKPPSARVS